MYSSWSEVNREGCNMSWNSARHIPKSAACVSPERWEAVEESFCTIKGSGREKMSELFRYIVIMK